MSVDRRWHRLGVLLRCGLLAWLCWVTPSIAEPAVAASQAEVQQMPPGDLIGQWPAAQDDSRSGWRLWTSFVYLLILAGIAVAVARWRKMPLWGSWQARTGADMIKVEQQLRVSPQLTLVVARIDGARFLIAASAQAISITPLEASREV